MSTGNTDRMKAELLRAVSSIRDLHPGYRDALVQAALECITDTAEHDDRRLNINQRFDAQIEKIAQQAIIAKGGGLA